MRGWWAAIVSGAALLSGGCNIAYYASHNLVNEPLSRLNEHKLSSRYRSAARTAWHDYERCHGSSLSHAFGDGFRDGYADQLENGGPPRSPAVPPLKYRRPANSTEPEGREKAVDYLAGFQQGAEAAAATGRRNVITLPVVKPTEPPETPLPITVIPATGAKP